MVTAAFLSVPRAKSFLTTVLQQKKKIKMNVRRVPNSRNVKGSLLDFFGTDTAYRFCSTGCEVGGRERVIIKIQIEIASFAIASGASERLSPKATCTCTYVHFVEWH